MSRDAKLYLLDGKNWKPLAELIKNHTDQYLQKDITIFQLHNAKSIGEYYAIITRTESADKIIEDYGATECGEKDSLRTTLHDYIGDPIFGDKDNLLHLKRLD